MIYKNLNFLSHEGYDEKEIFKTGIDNYEVEIYDFSDNTSFTDTFELLAIQFIDDGLYGEIPKSLEFYLDYEKMARDLRMDYSEFESNIIGRVA
jgi:Antirestriction protein (ArdA).